MSVQRINFTHRTKLTREQANILIHADGIENTATFEARLNLAELGPSAADARVFVEAYHQTTRMRFDFGTVAALTEPPLPQRKLAEFDDWKDVRFRVKVTNVTDTPGKLVAWANGITPKGPDDQDEPDLVRFKDADLYGKLWDLVFDDAGPVVYIEKRHGAQQVGRDDRFRAAVYPEIMRRTLEFAFIEERIAYPQPYHWSTTWVDGFVHAKLGFKPISALGTEDDAAVREWINNAVGYFARKHNMADLWAPTEQEQA